MNVVVMTNLLLGVAVVSGAVVSGFSRTAATAAQQPLDGAAGQNGRKIVLLYTDGEDSHSSIGLPGLIDLVKASDVTLYAIGELEHQSSSRLRAARAIGLEP